MNATLEHAFRVLGVEPGVGPLAARRRYRELIKEWHPDRHPAGSAAQAEATRRTQEINVAYRTIRDAARHREVPLRRARPSPTASSTPVPDLSKDTVAERVIAGAAWALLGLLIARALTPDSEVVRVALPAVLGLAGAALGWRSLDAVIRYVGWWL
jgi:preprotein translocase subunit Sec63